MKNRKEWSREDITTLLSNNQSKTIEELCLLLDRCENSIRTKLVAFGLSNRNKLKSNTLVKNSKILSDALEMFYWIGFILADGWIKHNDRHSSIGISIGIQDMSHLEKLGSYLDIPIHKHVRKTNFAKQFEYVTINIHSDVNVPMLMKKFDIKNHKSHNPPDFYSYKFDDEQILALLIGFVDGDGSICRRRNGNSEQTIVSIQTHSSWKSNLEFMNDFLKRYFNIKLRNKVRMNCRNHAYVSWTKKDLLSELKAFAVIKKLPILERKWEHVVT